MPTYHNLFEQTHRLLESKSFDAADKLLRKPRGDNPRAGEVILCWTQLQCARGKTTEALVRVTGLIKGFPRNPYYLLAAVHIITTTAIVPASSLLKLLETVAEHANASADVLSKIGFSAVMRGYWSHGLRYFVKGMRATANARNIILLQCRNRDSLEKFFEEARNLDTLTTDFNQAPLNTMVRALAIMRAAEDAGLPEAGPVIEKLSAHIELAGALRANKIASLSRRHCSSWIALQAPVLAARPHQQIVHWNYNGRTDALA